MCWRNYLSMSLAFDPAATPLRPMELLSYLFQSLKSSLPLGDYSLQRETLVLAQSHSYHRVTATMGL